MNYNLFRYVYTLVFHLPLLLLSYAGHFSIGPRLHFEAISLAVNVDGMASRHWSPVMHGRRYSVQGICNIRVRRLLLGPHSHSISCDDLCLHNESAHLRVFTNKSDSQIDSSAVTESREILRRGFPHDKKAIDAGFRIVALLNQRKSNSTIRKLRSYVGKRAAFYCLLQPPEMVVSGTMKNQVRTTVIVHFEPSLKRQPIIISSSIVCVIKSIDIDKRIIRVEASPADWRIVGTG